MPIQNLDYCGIINLLRQLIKGEGCTEGEAQAIARHIALRHNINVIFDL